MESITYEYEKGKNASFETASKPPHSKGFAANYAALIEIQSCISLTAFPIEFLMMADVHFRLHLCRE